MIGAIIGDIVGSRFEFDNIKTKKFELFDRECSFTDDTVMTLAVANSFIDQNLIKNSEEFKSHLINNMHKIGGRYPLCGFGGRFADWIMNKETKPYSSYGNGSAMRVSSIGWVAKSLTEAEELAKLTAEVTHNHIEGIKGAQAVAGSIFIAKTGKGKPDIKEYIESNYYNLNFTLDEIRSDYGFDVSCQGSVPQAIRAFLESTNFEDTIRCAVSIGGDSDTIAAISGSIAEAYYGVSDDIKETALSFLDDYLLDIYYECEKLKQ